MARGHAHAHARLAALDMQSCTAASRFAACGRPISRIGYQILAEGLGLAGREKGEVRLVVGVHAGHQLDVGPVVVGQAAVPRVAEFVVAPRPLLLAGRDVVIGDMHEPGLRGVIVAAEKILVASPTPCSWSEPECWHTSSDRWRG